MHPAGPGSYQPFLPLRIATTSLHRHHLIRHARYFTLQLAESYLTRPLFRQIVARIEGLAWHPNNVSESPTSGAGADELRAPRQRRCF